MKKYNILQMRKFIARLFTAIVLISLSIALFSCGVAPARGSAIITGTTRPAISPSEVRIFVDAPTQYEVIGIVEATMTLGGLLSRQETQDRVVNELKSQAARLGANGVILISTGTQLSPVSSSGSQSERVVTQGRAIFVIEE